ncbi:MFS transporter [Actinokineospora sp. PR83]|uniref:MFS transporter n=1 Tax=Actinokineospora sp. PR83 TaxID=2884908 RepID=UPI0027E0C68B|nr:MFS transporter [Actinokineospora sp. PR83]MCG8919835.1 MFS transporter [Actinokineospora sp. PR83]
MSRWPVVIAFAALGVSTQVCWLAYAAITTATATHFGVSDPAVGWLANLFPLLFVLLSVPAGRLLDTRLRPALALAAVLLGLGALTRVAVDAYWAALLGQGLAALAQPLAANAITRVAAAYLEPRHRPLGIAVGAGATYVGMIVAIGVGTAIPDDVPLVVAVGAGLTLVTVIAALLALRGRPPFEVAVRRPPSLAAVARQPGVALLATVVFAGMGVFVALATWLEPLLKPGGVAADASGLLMLTMLVAGIAGCAVIPPLAARKTAEPTALLVTAVVTAVVTAPACLLLALAPGVATGFAAALPIGFLLLAALPVALAHVERTAGDSAGTTTALLWLTGNAGGVVVSLAAGSLLGTPGLAFGLFALLALGAAGLAHLLRRGPRVVDRGKTLH